MTCIYSTVNKTFTKPPKGLVFICLCAFMCTVYLWSLFILKDSGYNNFTITLAEGKAGKRLAKTVKGQNVDCVTIFFNTHRWLLIFNTKYK